MEELQGGKQPMPQLDKDQLAEGKRQMQICNSCRYCEGYCAVWRAIEWRRDFSNNDMAYLANLCHDCRDCYYACPFTAPHEFGINPPKIFSGLREETYRKYAWPGSWAKTLGEKSKGFWITAILSIVLLFVLVFATSGLTGIGREHLGTASFYKVISETVMVAVFSILGLWMFGGWIVGARKFWLDIKTPSDQVKFKDWVKAIYYSMSLRYLDGEGTGCTYPEPELSGGRRWFHHLVAYGFLLDFASTTLGAFYAHVLHVPAPYPWYHPVVILGTLGGVGIIIGVSGLLYLKAKSDKQPSENAAVKSGTAFSVALLTVAVTGMLLLFCRETVAMGTLLVIHLGCVASLFFTAPYTKFTHFVYRFLALVRYAYEERVNTASSQETQKVTPPVVSSGATASK